MDWLSKVALFHTDWIAVVNKFGDSYYSEDIVQEMYIKLYKLDRENAVIVNGQVNRYYIYLTLKSICMNFKKEQKKYKKIEINESLMPEQEIFNNELFLAHEKILSLINSEVEKWNTFDKELYKIFRDKKVSMRSISRDSNIGIRTICRSLNDSKKRLNELFNEDYQDFINQDYELI